MEQRIVAHLGYRKRKVGASWNEGYEVLFILEITKGAKQASRSDVGHVYHLSTNVGGLSGLSRWVMDAPTIPVSADSSEGNFGDAIDIGVDVVHLVPVAAVAFLAVTIVATLARHEEAIRGIL
ncbi:hypothetical protein Tco_0385865 [Tanacetum coccineum]